MPGQRNQLAPPEIDDRVWSDTRGSSGQLYPPNADTPGYTFGSFGQIPTTPPPNTYTGVLPTPPNDYAAASGNLPNDYYHMKQLMNQYAPNDPRLNQLLQLLYFQRQGRT